MTERAGNRNRIQTRGFSNPATRALYDQRCHARRGGCRTAETQCGGCAFFAEFNADWGLCCYAKSRHYLETVFEHFTCAAVVSEHWGHHSFSADPAHHCCCTAPRPPERPALNAHRQVKRRGKRT